MLWPFVRHFVDRQWCAFVEHWFIDVLRIVLFAERYLDDNIRISDPLCSITALPSIPVTTVSNPTNTTESTVPVSTTLVSGGLNSTVVGPTSTPVLNNTGTTSGFSTPTDISSGGLTSASQTSIIFPTGNATSVVPTSTFSGLSTLTALPVPSTVTTATPSLESQFSFLTQSSLLVSEVSTSTSVSGTTLTDPDEPTTSVLIESVTSGATVTSAPLPSDLPSRIYPAEGGVSANDVNEGYTPVSIMFDSTLGWEFVAKNTDSAAQIFAYFPTCLEVALGITSDQVKVFALQVWEPSTYTSTADADQLRTIFISYIPSENVTALEQSIRKKTSSLYTDTSGISAQLAQRIDASFSVTSVPDPISGGANDSSSGSSSSSSSDHTRLDAIIGVCSTLGGIALCILGFLVYRNFKRRQQAAHHRLTDSNVGGTPAPGQAFYCDSTGGQRRHSFYYAEDSLRGYAQDPIQHDVSSAGPSAGVGVGMRERRVVVPGTISAPILRDNTLNW
ncbi:hypothetical protein M0805_006254 [Coniferiporia weirii]|nr:hypothetical protein M0805_006254 [Coniferiporia weirii]